MDESGPPNALLTGGRHSLREVRLDCRYEPGLLPPTVRTFDVGDESVGVIYPIYNASRDFGGPGYAYAFADGCYRRTGHVTSAGLAIYDYVPDARERLALGIPAATPELEGAGV